MGLPQHRLTLLGGLLSYLAKTYEPLILLGHDETSGAVAKDSSGNGNDIPYNGSPTLGNTGPFSTGKGFERELSAGCGSGVGYTITPDPTSADTHSLVVFADLDGAKDSVTFLIVVRTTLNTLSAIRANGTSGNAALGYFSSGASYEESTRVLAIGMRGVWALSYDSGANVGTLYENGLPFFTSIAATKGNFEGRVGIGALDDIDGNRWLGNYPLTQIQADALTDDEQYDIAKRAGATPAEGHYFREVIDNELGIAGSCVAHHPLWETAGAQAIDVSGNGNHGTFVSGPTLGQDPVSEGFLRSIGGVTGQLTLASVINANADFTVAGSCGAGSEHADGFMVVGNTNNCVLLGRTNDNVTLALRGLTAGVGADTENVAIPAGSFGWCVRKSGNAVDWWIDGVKQTAPTAFTGALNSDTKHLIKDAEAHGYTDAACNMNHHGTFNAALTDAQCARLSETTI